MKGFTTWTTRLFIINPILAFGFLWLCPIGADCENQNRFTFGSTISEVVAAQGEPDSVVVNSFQLDHDSKKVDASFTYNYGKSKVDINVDDGRVYGWLNYRDNPLKTSFRKDYLLLPEHFDTDKDYFTLNATEDEVIVIQGRPDYIYRYRYKVLGETHRFIYGDIDGESGSVKFENGRVIGWDIRTVPLKVKLVPKKNTVEKDYFTLGSTMDEVAAIHGIPDYCSRWTVQYGSSELHLRNGRVAGWKNTNSNPLKVKLLPKRKTINKGYFTLESTKDEVLAVQGTPDMFFGGDTFYYGSSDESRQNSKVYFENDRVSSWKNTNSNPLKVKLLPKRKTINKGYFTLESTKDEVLAVQGTPDMFFDYDTFDGTVQGFSYGSSDEVTQHSKVCFENDRVIGWGSETSNPLKTKPFSGDCFTIGSTQEEVLAIHGTPDYQDDYTFWYSASRVSFNDNRVTGWYSFHTRRLKVGLLPDKNTANRDYFTIGSTIDEVLTVQGTPDGYRIGTPDDSDKGRTFRYDLSEVYFRNGHVAEWDNSPYSPLKVKESPDN